MVIGIQQTQLLFLRWMDGCSMGTDEWMGGCRGMVGKITGGRRDGQRGGALIKGGWPDGSMDSGVTYTRSSETSRHTLNWAMVPSHSIHFSLFKFSSTFLPASQSHN